MLARASLVSVALAGLLATVDVLDHERRVLERQVGVLCKQVGGIKIVW